MSWTNISRVFGLAMGFACCATAFGETSINATVTGSSEGGPFTSALTVGNENGGCTVNYSVTVELTDTDNGGLALVGFDLELVDDLGVNAGPPLPQADAPTDGDMTSFVIPDGLNNPAGFGGTLIGNKLVQVGGGSNTIRNVQSCTVDADCPGSTNTCDGVTCTASAPYPIGAVITGIAQPGSPQVVVTGSFTAPIAVGTYAFKLTALFGNAIIAGEDGNPFWATKALDIAGGTGVVTDLTLTVQAAACASCAIESSIPPDGAIDARQPKSADGQTPFGWDSVELSFTCARAADLVVDGPTAFASTGPAVTAVAMVDPSTVTLTLASRLVPETWTRITHIDSGTSICLGNLPGDVDADGFSSPTLDLTALIDCLNNLGTCADYQADIDRDLATGVLDLTRLIDLYNGAGVFDSWSGATIGPSCPPG